MKYRVVLSLFMVLLMVTAAAADECADCHQKITPNIVTDFKLSRMSQEGLNCPTCHGESHKTAADVAAVKLPTPDTCKACHEDRVEEFSKGKHAMAWPAMKAMPTAHMQPMYLMDGMKGCGGCHKLGPKSEEELKKLRESGGFGNGSCDACHTRHTFSLAEARSPQACQTCHMGFDHPNWETFISSKHGVRYDLKQSKVIPETSAAPTCQMCHMQEGNHEVRTAWGFLAVRLPMPEDKDWAADRATILQALGVLDPEGKPTARLDVVKAAQVARLTQEDWQKERDKMLNTCHQCHSLNFARIELEKGDKMIREADRLMAEAIRVVAALYKDGIIPKPKDYAFAFPDLLAFHDAPTVVEQKLFVMFLEHRMRTYQGAFHANPDYAFWYGWSELVKDLSEIKEKAAAMRAEKH